MRHVKLLIRKLVGEQYAVDLLDGGPAISVLGKIRKYRGDWLIDSPKAVEGELIKGKMKAAEYLLLHYTKLCHTKAYKALDGSSEYVLEEAGP